MTVRIPLGVLRVMLLLAVVWGGAAGIAIAVNYWLDDQGDYVRDGELRTELLSYARDGELAEAERALAFDLLVSATGDSAVYDATALQNSYFEDADLAAFQACINAIVPSSLEAAQGLEACDEVVSAVDFKR